MFLLSVFLAATAAIGYEIIAAATLVNLLGSSVFYFSLTIGVFLAALGLGAWLSQRIPSDPPSLLRSLVVIESLVTVLGGGLSALFFWLYAAIISGLRQSHFASLPDLLSGIGSSEVLFNLSAFGLLLLVGLLVGFELPLFSRFLAQEQKLGAALGNVFFWDYAGALAAAIALPVFLFPRWGLVKTSFFLGLLNALAALILIYQYARTPRPVRSDYFRGLIFLLLALAATGAGFFWADRLEVFLQQKLYGDREILYHRQTPYQGITYTRSPDGKVSLYLSGQLQFESGRWDAVYHESLVHPAFLLRPAARSILVLGGGDGLALREILKYPSVEAVTLVDIDPEMIRVSQSRAFIRGLNQESFSDPRIRVVFADAFKFVERTRERYDIIFVDFPDAQDETLSRLYAKEFYQNLGRRLADDGVAVIQSTEYLAPVHRVIAATLAAAGLEGLPYRSYGSLKGSVLYNFGFTLASREGIQPSDFRGKHIAVPTRLFREEYLGMMFKPGSRPGYMLDFGVKGREPPIRVNSVFRPTILEHQRNLFARRYFSIVSPREVLRQTIGNPLR